MDVTDPYVVHLDVELELIATHWIISFDQGRIVLFTEMIRHFIVRFNYFRIEFVYALAHDQNFLRSINALTTAFASSGEL